MYRIENHSGFSIKVYQTLMDTRLINVPVSRSFVSKTRMVEEFYPRYGSRNTLHTLHWDLNPFLWWIFRVIDFKGFSAVGNPTDI